MRIISGKMGGMNLISPKDKKVRPTTNRIKEDIFNIIMPYVEEGVILDLFSGSGNIGLEAISRGARLCYFIDNNNDSIKLTKENVGRTKANEFAIIKKNDAINFVSKTGEKFDIIYLDPPYNYEKIDFLIENIVKYDILKKNGILIVEFDKNKEVFTPPYHKFKSKVYSLSKIDFYIKE